MYKLLLLTLFSALWMLAQAYQIDEEMAIRTLFHGKQAVNRAAHAAAQQLDREALAGGTVRIDEEAAGAAALAYLRANLRLDENGEPLPGSRLRERVEVRVLRVVNGDAASFPFTYRNESYDYEVTLQRPGVILIATVRHPHTFAAMGPIEWDIKGAAELVYVE